MRVFNQPYTLVLNVIRDTHKLTVKLLCSVGNISSNIRCCIQYTVIYIKYKNQNLTAQNGSSATRG